MGKNNEVTAQLKIDYPIIQAGMAGGITTPELVAAVSNAGGLGTLGAGYMNIEDLKRSLQDIKQQTTCSFGVNIFIPEYPDIVEEEIEKANHLLEPIRKDLHLDGKPQPELSRSLFDHQLEVVLKHQVPVCSFTFGVPSKEVIRDLKKEGIIVVGTATTVEEALINEERGMDMVVAQGSEAGGHRGTFLNTYDSAMIGTMSLIPQVVDHLRIPTIAAGGIMDSRGFKAAFALGAQGVQLGTAFVTCAESGAKPQHKEAILKTPEHDTIITRAFSGKPARGIANQFTNEMRSHEEDLPGYPLQNSLTKDIRKEAAKQNKPQYMSLWSGQSPRLSQSISAGELIEKIVEQASLEG
ncbi:putative nitronate monooxygenase [Halobacillus andaensis]|uniref:Probable nitronate monooxygenase n=1 Tax=Halobacillus andaensis TaxID=1176239 RepID=A0A917B663_HALAA|nr:nitronate monooxygenase [Halobacillus andaensis]MBP2005696.1 nitronate monooxygenase [Halobacillus andaensis]GGF26694.1 putative nitronate monooxygenase [Halobacillus andaensis]